MAHSCDFGGVPDKLHLPTLLYLVAQRFLGNLGLDSKNLVDPGLSKVRSGLGHSLGRFTKILILYVSIFEVVLMRLSMIVVEVASYAHSDGVYFDRIINSRNFGINGHKSNISNAEYGPMNYLKQFFHKLFTAKDTNFLVASPAVLAFQNMPLSKTGQDQQTPSVKKVLEDRHRRRMRRECPDTDNSHFLSL